MNKTEERAKAEENLQQAITDKEAALLELEELSNYNAELHQNCDFIMKNFEIRQIARDEEIGPLKQAKSILSGAKITLKLPSRSMRERWFRSSSTGYQKRNCLFLSQPRPLKAAVCYGFCSVW